jgi:hypothetical protein
MAIVQLPPRQLTEQERNEIMVRRLLIESCDSLIALAKKHKELFELFWKKPQAYCNILGNQGYTFFEESRRTQEFLALALGESVFAPYACSIPSTKNVIISENGSVQITDKEPVNE